MFGRPLLRTSYEQDAAIFPTFFQKGFFAVFILALLLMGLGNSVFAWLPDFLLGTNWINPVTNMLPIAISALGFNILLGVTGQVSLGQAFFMGVGAYTAVSLGGEGTGGIEACVPFHEQMGLLDARGQCGLGLPIWIWLPAAGIGAALVGILVSPAAVRVRGLYLAIVTIGLVFIGLHLGRMLPEYAGDFESGRTWPSLDITLWNADNPLVSMTSDGEWFGSIFLTEEQKQFFFLLALLVVAAVIAKNIIRSRTGRAFQAIRDRDVAAEVMGVPEFRYKMMSFAISSFYAGIGGALFASYNGRLAPVNWSLFLSVDFIAILLIGGAGTIVGTLLGSVFVELIPDVVETFTEWLGEQTDASGPIGWIANFIISQGPGDFGFISLAAVSPGWPMSVFFWNFVIFGVLIIVFMIFEPLGLFGIWAKVRNYWKRWPFSY